MRLIRWAAVHVLDLVAGFIDRGLDISFSDVDDTTSQEIR